MRIFKSKVDSFIIMLTIIPILVATTMVAIVAKGDLRPVLIVLVVIGIVGIFIYRTMTGTEYVIDGAELRIRSGFLSWTIAIDSIESIEPTRNASSAPALSLDRLAIRYWKDGDRKVVLVSPVDKHGFIAALRTVKPTIRG